MHTHHQVKIIGSNGQVSLGKEFAGKMVLVDQIEEGTWLIKSGVFVPDSEKWLYQDQNLTKLEKALKWAGVNKPIDNFEQLAKEVEDAQDKN